MVQNLANDQRDGMLTHPQIWYIDVWISASRHALHGLFGWLHRASTGLVVDQSPGRPRSVLVAPWGPGSCQKLSSWWIPGGSPQWWFANVVLPEQPCASHFWMRKPTVPRCILLPAEASHDFWTHLALWRFIIGVGAGSESGTWWWTMMNHDGPWWTMGFWGILLFSATPHSCQSVWKAASSHVSRRLPVGSLANRVSKYPVSWKTHVGIREKEVGKAVSFFYSHPLLPGLGGAYPLTAAVAGGSDRVGQAENAHSCWGPFFGGTSGCAQSTPRFKG